jgi:hypothetical protein
MGSIAGNDGVKERPIIFSAPMVRALLCHSKSQTRRIVKPQSLDLIQSVAGMADWRQARKEDIGQDWVDAEFHVWNARHPDNGRVAIRCAYGQPGDRLWVKETWRDPQAPGDSGSGRRVIYRADDILQSASGAEHAGEMPAGVRWRSSLFMPRWASRILLEVVSVRIERLQDISVADAIAEGMASAQGDPRRSADVPDQQADGPVAGYRKLFETLNGAGSWQANPWVWVVDFKPLQTRAYST